MEVVKPEDIIVGQFLMVSGNKRTNDRSFMSNALIVKAIDLPYITIQVLDRREGGLWSDTDEHPFLMHIDEYEFVQPSEEFLRTSFKWFFEQKGQTKEKEVSGKKITASLFNWQIVPSRKDHSNVIEYKIMGHIYDDARLRFPNGTEVTTSPIKSLDLDAGIVITENSIYKLKNQAGDENEKDKD